jgi:hypothetical protein
VKIIPFSAIDDDVTLSSVTFIPFSAMSMCDFYLKPINPQIVNTFIYPQNIIPYIGKSQNNPFTSFIDHHKPKKSKKKNHNIDKPCHTLAYTIPHSPKPEKLDSSTGLS